MRNVRLKMTEVLGMGAIIWIGFNLLTLWSIAYGKQGDYIPYVHAPIKFLFWLAN